MEAISTWILSLCGMVLVGLLIDIIMPQKVLTKFVKTLVGVFTLFVAISPFTNFDINKFGLNDIFSSIQIDSGFINNREEEKVDAVKKSIEESLNNNGYKNVQIDLNINQENGLITGVFVDLKNLVLSGQNVNIDKYTNIVAIIKQFVTINEDKIVFYE